MKYHCLACGITCERMGHVGFPPDDERCSHEWEATESTYLRVIPRDLFNEAKLLKCLGQLSLLFHDGVDANGRRTPVSLSVEATGEPFAIEQDQSSGSLYCATVLVKVRGELVWLSSAYNSKSPYPLQFGECEEPVFADDGTLSDEFMAFAN